MVENNDKKTEEKQTSSFSVSSKKTPNRGKSISINIPEIKKPNIKNIPPPRKWSTNVVITAVLIVTLIGGYGGSWIENHNNNGNVTFASLGSQEKIVTSQSQLINQIAKTVGPSVVSVNVSINSGSSTSGSGGFGLFGFSQPEEEQAAGTGIIISSDGLILTNRHVVPVGTTNVSVTLSDGTELKNVSVVGRTSQSDSLDVAFLKDK